MKQKVTEQEHELQEVNIQLNAKNFMANDYLLQKSELDLLKTIELQQLKEIERMYQQIKQTEIEAEAYKHSNLYKIKSYYEATPKYPSYYLRIFLDCCLKEICKF